MILVDTSVWVDHLRRHSGQLADRLERGEVCTHPFVIGELACGGLRRRDEILGALARLPRAPIAAHDEVLGLVATQRLWGVGIGWVDAHLLASTKLAGARLWTRDRPLAAAGRRSGVPIEG